MIVDLSKFPCTIGACGIYLWRRINRRAITGFPLFQKENRMRRLLSAVTALSLLSAQPLLAQPQCNSMTDQSAFEVQALRSELMVLATGCHEDNRYNAFIRRYQSDLQANERAIDTYFKHRFGSSGQTEHDRFVTELANAMSRQGSDLGGDFCPRNGLIFNEVLALPSASDLPNYAAGKDLVPASITICAPLPTGRSKTHTIDAKSSGKTTRRAVTLN
jgi:hypothetical protein